MKNEIFVVIYNQIGIQEIIPTGIDADYYDEDTEQNGWEKAEELAEEMVQLPYEHNPLPSGGMGLGGYALKDNQSLRHDAQEVLDFLDYQINGVKFEHASIREAKLLLKK